LKVTGKIEAIAKEGEHGVPAGWHLVRVGGQDVLFQLGMSPGKVGDGVLVECVGSKIGLKAISVERTTGDITTSKDYASLCNDCKEINRRIKKSLADSVIGTWELGRRILDFDPKYGDGTITRLAADLSVSVRYLYYCKETAEAYETKADLQRDLEAKIARGAKLESFTDFRKTLVEKPRSPPSDRAGYASTPAGLPVNPSATPQELVDAYRIEPKPLPEAGGSGPEVIMHQFLGRLKIPYTSEVPMEREDGKPAKADFVIANNLILENTNDLHESEKDIPRDKGLAGNGRLVFRIHDDVLRAYKPPMEVKE
jgi:hypothetical protein